MDIGRYISIARSQWRILLAALVFGVLAAVAYLVTATAQYTATAEVLVVTTGAQNANELVQTNDYSQSQIRSYIVVATRPVVLQPVIEDLEIEATPAALSRQLSVNSPLNTTVISVSATDESPELAADIANGVAQQLSTTVAGFVPTEADGTNRVSLEPIKQAEPPTQPSSPNTKLTVLLGIILGLVLGVVIVAIRKSLDNRVRVPADVTQVVDTPQMGLVAQDPSVAEHPVIFSNRKYSPRAESYRQIRTNVRFLRAVTHRNAIAFTSTVPGEGKSMTAANVAVAMAMAGERVCLIEADLRRPKLGNYLGLESSVGLTSVLLGENTFSEAVLHWGRLKNMDILLAGEKPPNPSELLGSEDFRQLLRSIEGDYDSIVVDCTPLLPVTDGAIVANACGGAVLVIGSGLPTRTELTTAVDALRGANAPLLGYVLNRVKEQSLGYYHYNYVQEGAKPKPEHPETMDLRARIPDLERGR